MTYEPPPLEAAAEALTGDGEERPAPEAEATESETVAPPAALRVLAQMGQSLPGQRLYAQIEYEVADTPEVRQRIESGLLKLIEPGA